MKKISIKTRQMIGFVIFCIIFAIPVVFTFFLYAGPKLLIRHFLFKTPTEKINFKKDIIVGALVLTTFIFISKQMKSDIVETQNGGSVQSKGSNL